MIKIYLKKVTSNKTRDIELKTKLEKTVKIISIKRLTADLINKYSIPNGPKSFSLIFLFFLLQNYLVFQLFINHFTFKDAKIYSWKSKGISEESITSIYNRRTFLSNLFYWYIRFKI